MAGQLREIDDTLAAAEGSFDPVLAAFDQRMLAVAAGRTGSGSPAGMTH